MNDPKTSPELPGEGPRLGRIESKIDRLISIVDSLSKAVLEVPQLRQRISDLELDVALLQRDGRRRDTTPASPLDGE